MHHIWVVTSLWISLVSSLALTWYAFGSAKSSRWWAFLLASILSASSSRSTSVTAWLDSLRTVPASASVGFHIWRRRMDCVSYPYLKPCHLIPSSFMTK